jgi:hypothetical protein
MSSNQTKKAYLSKFPFVTHVPSPNFKGQTDPVFNFQYNDWFWSIPQNIKHHPINSLNKGINPFRNLFAELVVTGQVSWDGSDYTFGDPSGFWHTCKKYNINPRFPPSPIFTAPSRDQHCFKAIAEYYNLFGTFNHINNPDFWIPHSHPTTLKPLKTNFQFPLSGEPVSYTKRRHCPECSDTSSSDEPQDFSSAKRIKTEDTDI